MLATSRYRFEYRLNDWAQRLSRSLAGEDVGVFVGLRSDGSVRRVYCARGASFAADQKEQLAQRYDAWLLFVPKQAGASGYLEWLNLPQPVAERWLGRALEAADFLDVRTTSSRDGWPSSWRVWVD